MKNQIIESENVFLKKNTLLVLTTLLIIASGMRWNVQIAAWLFPIPILLYTRMNYSQKQLWATLTFSFCILTIKIASEPLHFFIAILSGVQSGFFYWLIFFTITRSRKYFNELQVVLLFAVLLTIGEYIGAMTSALGVWGMVANTQLENLPLLQVASITGAYGISFLIILTAGLSETLLFTLYKKETPKGSLLKAYYALLIIHLLVHTYGAIRLDGQIQGQQMRVAGVSAKEFGIMDVLKNEKSRLGNNTEVYRLIQGAADQKAQLIITNEGGLALLPAEETLMKQKIQKFAKRNNVNIMLGYIILRGKDKKFLNKMIVVTSKGYIFQDYYKQFIPPGEPAEIIESEIMPLKIPYKKSSIILGGAICYDFDSMAITKQHGKNEAGLVGVPSSDWRGIDPVHTQMARLRAIEQGYSVARSSRASVSEFYDAYGRIRGSLPWFEKNDQILVASLPVEPVFTVYKTFGDWFVLLNLLYLIWAIVAFFRLRKRNKH